MTCHNLPTDRKFISGRFVGRRGDFINVYAALLGQAASQKPVSSDPRMSSCAEEFHLRALPDPCMTLSSHTAPDVRPLP